MGRQKINQIADSLRDMSEEFGVYKKEQHEYPDPPWLEVKCVTYASNTKN